MSLPNQRVIRKGRVLAIAIAAAILLVTAIALQVGGVADWGVDDAAAAAGLLLATGGAYVLAARLPGRHLQHIVVGCLLAAVLVFVWAELAVGIFDV